MHIKFRLKLIVISIILIVLIVGASFLISDNKPIINHATDTYEFPITADKTPDEWKKLNDYGEMISVLQMPENVLATISTEGLFETCLNYPLYGDLLAFNYYQYGFESLCRFNGLKELMNKSGAGAIILDYYRNLDYNNLDKYTEYPICFIPYIEMMLAQESVLSGMELSERRELLNISLKRSKGSGLANVIVGRILRKDNKEFQEYLKENPSIENFINNAPAVGFLDEDWNRIVKKFAY